MPDYNKLREQCQNEINTSVPIIDEFLLSYGAKRDKLDQEFETRISVFRHAYKEMASNWYGLVKAQYIAHRIFKKDGLVAKYLKHVAIKDLDSKDQIYLQQMALHPWRFSFSEIKANPATDFFEMVDVFTGESYLLYSRGVSRILREHPVLLWFNLIGFNGSCWQTFGPVGNFQSFSPDDIFFYATELNESIESEEDLVKDLEYNPVPYMMLITGSNYPLILNGEDEILQVTGESYSPMFNMLAMKKEFRIEYAEGIFKLREKTWSESPHFAEAYFVENKEMMFLSSLTERGYLEMVKRLKFHDFNFSNEPDIRLHLSMLTVMKQLLKREIELNPYSRLFSLKTLPENDAFIKKLNNFMMLALPEINAGKDTDINAMAEKIGIDAEIARDFLQTAMDRIKPLQK